MKISVAMIVKNEEECLERCLESVKDADEIVICDTGSTDRTIEIAKKYTDKVFTDYVWRDDFSEARNHAISKCTGDWIMSIDADHELLSSMDEVREWAQKAEDAGMISAKLMNCWDGDDGFHWREKLIKRDSHARWKGRVHECIMPASDFKTDIKQRIRYSINHQRDPDRNIRILKKSEQTSRTKFYLGREYYERRRYKEAIQSLEGYLREGKWLPEMAEAHLTLARCYEGLNDWGMARHHLLMAININANFKEAILFLARLSYPKNAERWRQMAELADNSGVLFVRTK